MAIEEPKESLAPLVDQRLAEISPLPFAEALTSLHELERRTRLAKDDLSNDRVCREIAERCVRLGKWEELSLNIQILSKRRGVMRRAMTTLIDLCVDNVAAIPDEDVKVAFVKSIMDIAEGKIYLEVQRVRLAKLVVDRLERENKPKEALDLLQDLRLKVLTSMEENERVELLLRQFRLCLDTGDRLRGALCADIDASRAAEPLQLELLRLSVRYHSEQTGDHLALSQTQERLFAATKESEALVGAIASAVLARSSPEQKAQCTHLSQIRSLALQPDARKLLDVFRGRRVMTWADFSARFASLIPPGRESLMRERLIEHNLRLFATFYSRVRLDRLAQLADVSVDELEERIISLVFTEQFYARIDRPRGTIRFRKPPVAAEVADQFGADVMHVCRLIDRVHSLIEKERQQQKLGTGGAEPAATATA